MSLKNLPLFQKIIVSFSMVLVVGIATSWILFVLDGRAKEMLDASQRTSSTLTELSHAGAAYLDQAQTMRGYLLTGSERHSKLYSNAIAQFKQDIDAAKTDSADNPEIQQAIDNVAAAALAWREQIGDPAVSKFANHATDEALTLAKSPHASELQQAYRDAFNSAELKIGNLSDIRNKSITTTLWLITMSQLVGGAGAAIAAILAGLWLYAINVTPFLRMTRVMNELAAGNTSINVAFVERQDEVGAMAKALQVFKDVEIGKVLLQTEAEVARRHAEDIRALRESEKAEEARVLRAASDALNYGLEQMANGNLAYRIDAAFHHSLENIKSAFNSSIERIHDTIRSIHENADGIKRSTEEIASVSGDLSHRTEQQAANLEETAAALGEITTTVQKTALGAKQAQEIVSDARNDAQHSGDVVQRAVDAMSKIEKSSQEISQIIGVIDEIAFQTNLLALNAGVEAARAGDAGRGFAVVASEVRALAQRSADAAKEIKGLISTSTQAVGEGVKLVGETGSSLERIVSKIIAINTVVGSIASEALAQATTLNQVSSAVTQLDQVTQQNAAMAEEATAASQSLAREGDQLATLIAQFKLEQNGADSLRAELKKVAPHAFRQGTFDQEASSQEASSKNARPFAAAQREQDNPSRRSAKSFKRMAGDARPVRAMASAAADTDDWQEF